MNGAARLVRRGAGWVVRGLAAALSLALLVGTGYGWSVRQALGHVVTSDVLVSPARAEATATPKPDQPFTALLVGLDSRTDADGNPLPPELLAQLRAGTDEGQLHTDTIILLHVPAGPRAGAVAISIPRDSFVELANGGNRHKINSAYARAAKTAERDLTTQGVTGPELDRRSREAGRRALVATVEQFTEVPIDHYAEINLAGFVEMTEAVGGVPVCLKRPEREVRSGIDLPAGLQLVRGADALAFVRQRRGLGEGDLDRIARQQAFLAGMTSRVLSAGTLSDPAAVRHLVDAVTRNVVLDRGWELDRLIAQFRRASGGDIRFVTIPTGTLALSTPVDGVAVQVDPDQVRVFARDTIARADTTASESASGRVAASPPAPTSPTPDPAANPSTDPGAGGPSSTAISAAGVPCVD
jgi:LCP family protein required for cell wall assembly